MSWYDSWFKIEYERIVHETEKAVLVEYTYFGKTQVWLPRKGAKDFTETECLVKGWLAKKNAHVETMMPQSEKDKRDMISEADHRYNLYQFRLRKKMRKGDSEPSRYSNSMNSYINNMDWDDIHDDMGGWEPF